MLLPSPSPFPFVSLFLQAPNERHLGDTSANEAGGREGDGADCGESAMLRHLFDNGANDEGGMVAAMDHDEVVGVASGAHSSCASAREAARIEMEAKRIAREAADELQRSRRTTHHSRASNIAIPTWTGRSGGAGAPSFSSRGPASKPRPGNEKSVSSSKVTTTRSESEEIRKTRRTDDPACVLCSFSFSDFLSLPSPPPLPADIGENP